MTHKRTPLGMGTCCPNDPHSANIKKPIHHHCSAFGTNQTIISRRFSDDTLHRLAGNPHQPVRKLRMTEQRKSRSGFEFRITIKGHSLTLVPILGVFSSHHSAQKPNQTRIDSVVVCKTSVSFLLRHRREQRQRRTTASIRWIFATVSNQFKIPHSYGIRENPFC